ncbi:MAG: hypothetical protein HUU37_01995 [Bdellovibrionales bacterium]|nr:hypothetical protein [Bdellovibrionales bacterium]
MKFVFALIAALVAAPGFAAPVVGEKAVFDVELKLGANAVNGTLALEIIQVEADKFSIRTTVAFDGQEPNVKEEERGMADYADPVQVEQIIANCAAVGGSPEKVTVPAGEFDTCKISQVGEGAATEVWVARVPFANAQYREVRMTENGMMEITAKYRGDK